MRILVVTNLYPPHYIGGYELGCRDVVEKLRDRGHRVRVLTSRFRLPKVDASAEGPDVERVLNLKFGPSDPAHRKHLECGKLSRCVQSFEPEVIYFWNQDGLCLWLPLAARWKNCPMAFFLSDTSFVAWRIGAWLAAAARKSPTIRAIFGKTILVRGRSILRGQPCHFASEFLRRRAAQEEIGFAPRGSTVAHWGIDATKFSVLSETGRPVRRLLYAGQMIPQKGVHTALAALAALAAEKAFSDLTLTLVGGGRNLEYQKMLQEKSAELGIANRVRFLGQVTRGDLPPIYAQHDVLVFPSEWEEPFAITPLEAMAAGLVVVGTATGGSAELFRDRETAMTFQTGDAEDCARAIRELAGDRNLREHVASTGKQEVASNYTLDKMVGRIEASLQCLVARTARNPVTHGLST